MRRPTKVDINAIVWALCLRKEGNFGRNNVCAYLFSIDQMKIGTSNLSFEDFPIFKFSKSFSSKVASLLLVVQTGLQCQKFNKILLLSEMRYC